MRKWFVRAVLVIVGLLVVASIILAAVLYNETLAALHNPPEERKPMSKTPADFGLDYEALVLTTTDGLALAAWYIPSQNGAAIIVQHGYKSDRTVMLNIASILARHGYGIIMVDFRTHGMSEGSLITLGKLEQLDVDTAYRYLLIRSDVDPERIGAFGNSMGGATLLIYTAENPRIKAIVAQSSFARAEEVATKKMREYTGLSPSPLLLTLVRFFAEQITGGKAHDVAVVEHIYKISPRPVFLLQGGQDEHIPSDSGHRLYEAAGEPRELWYEPEQEHVFFDRDYPEEFEKRVVEFYDRYLLGK